MGDAPEEGEEIEALKKLVTLLTEQLGEKTQSLVLKKVIDLSISEDDPVYLFGMATSLGLDEDAFPLSIYVDWKASNEIEWQANRILQALGISDEWLHIKNGDVQTAPSVLLNFDSWLKRHDYCLLHVDTGGDEFLAFSVKQSNVLIALSLAKDAGMDVRTSEAFGIHNDCI